MRSGLKSKRTAAAAWAVFSVWLAGTAYAFWSLELQQQRSFESPRTALFDAGVRSRSAEAWFRAQIAPSLHRSGAAVATVVHVYSADCPCNRFTQPHLQRIVSRYQSRGVAFVAAEPLADEIGRSSDRGPVGLQRVALPAGGSLSWIEATPAALIFDAAGRLVYFGPYSDSARCGDSGGLVERALDRILRGEVSQPQPFYGGGCFCAVESNT